jgi:hypothetical protein
MRCPGCGAEMHLIEVAPDKTKMVPGYEQHTLECSGCHDHVRQLVFTPARLDHSIAKKCGSLRHGSRL